MSTAAATQVPVPPKADAPRSGRGDRGGGGRGGRNRNRGKKNLSDPNNPEKPSPAEPTAPIIEPEASHSTATSEPDVSGRKNLLKELSRYASTAYLRFVS